MTPYPPPPQPPAPDRSQQVLPWIIAFGVVAVMALVGVLLAIYLARQQAPAAAPTPLQPGGQPTNTVVASITLLPASTLTPARTQAPQASLTPSVSPLPSATLPPSAQPSATAASSALPPTCTAKGQTWIRPTDKMVMVCVPAGSFQIGMTNCTFDGCQKEVNGGTVDLPAYWIDRTEVTNAMFQQFVQQTGYVTGAERSGASEVYGLLTAVSGANWRFPQGPGSSISAKADHPVVQMNWYAANAYCKWAGGRLPSEAEWEKAARGTDGRLWPWGNAYPSDQLMNAGDVSLPEPQSRTDMNDGYRYTSPVGAFPAGQSPYGLMDMAANAWEWTRSIYKDYPYKASDGREVVSEPAEGDRMVLRGGCWFDDYGSVRSTMRYGGRPQLSTDGTGFRCVYP